MRLKRFMGVLAVVAIAAGLAAGVSSAAGPTVAICATLGEDVDMQTILAGTGHFSGVDVLDCEGDTPSVSTLQNYDAIFAFPDDFYDDFDALAQNLATYVDGGGHLVLAQWGFASCCGTWWGTVLDTGGYMPYTGSNVKDHTDDLDLVIEDPSNPMFANVTAVHTDNDVGTVSLRSGATSLAHWSNGQPAVAIKGDVVALNFWPDAEDSMTGDWVQLIENALGAPSAEHVNRAGFCTVAGNTTASGAAIPPGTFVDLGVDQPASDPHYKGARLHQDDRARRLRRTRRPGVVHVLHEELGRFRAKPGAPHSSGGGAPIRAGG
jgi:hypothetical protein